MAAVLEEDQEYQLRHIFRWYSRNFNTPLYQVEELPLVEVLQAWYECQYESIVHDETREEELLKELLDLSENEEQRRKREMETERKLDDDEQFAKTVEEAEPPPTKKDPGTMQELVEEVKSRQDMDIPKRKKFSEAELPATIKTLPPDVNMSFVDSDEFERGLEEESIKG